MARAGRTPWSTLDVGAVADMVDSMGAEQASADVAALEAAVKRARAAALHVETVFAVTADKLTGIAATNSQRRAATLSGEITAASTIAESAVINLRGVATALADAKAKGPLLREIARAMADPDADADDQARMRTTVATAMNAAYSDPMLATAAIPDGPRTIGMSMINPAVSPTDPGDGLAGTLGTAGKRDGGASDPGSLGLGGGGPSGAAANQPSTSGTVRPPTAPPNPSATTPATTTTANRTGRPTAPSDDNRSGPPSGAPGTPSPTPVGAQPNPRPGGKTPGTAPTATPTGVGRGMGVRTPGTSLRPASPLAAPRLAATTATATPTTAPIRPGGPSGTRGGMPFVPRARRAEDEEERKAADYLRVRENADELVGEWPLVGPSVLGEPEPEGDKPQRTT